MNKQDFQQIGSLLDRKLEQKLDKKFKPINQKLDEHSGKLDALLEDMVTVQQDVKTLLDIASKLEKIDDLEERVEQLESATPVLK